MLRVYKADPYLTDPDEIARQRARIANAYNALNHMPGHPAIVGVRDFAPVDEHEDRFVLVTGDVRGQALRLHIDKPNDELNWQAICADRPSALDRALMAVVTESNESTEAVPAIESPADQRARLRRFGVIALDVLALMAGVAAADRVLASEAVDRLVAVAFAILF